MGFKIDKYATIFRCGLKTSIYVSESIESAIESMRNDGIDIDNVRKQSIISYVSRNIDDSIADVFKDAIKMSCVDKFKKESHIDTAVKYDTMRIHFSNSWYGRELEIDLDKVRSPLKRLKLCYMIFKEMGYKIK